MYVGGTLVPLISKKQATLARSSTDAKYKAIVTTAQELEVVQSLLIELEVEVPVQLIFLMIDNLSASFIVRNPIGHLKLKHVALDDLYFVRECTEKGTLKVNHIPDTDQWVDVLTKALPPRSFSDIQNKLVGSFPQVSLYIGRIRLGPDNSNPSE